MGSAMRSSGLILAGWCSLVLALIACGCRGERPPYVPPPEANTVAAPVAPVGGQDAAAPPGYGPNDVGSVPVRPCTGARASGIAVLCVRPGDKTRTATIGAAVKAAKSGDVIQVSAGTYAEDVLIQDKALTLAGGFDEKFTKRALSTNETHIKGSGKNSVVRVVAEGKTVQIDGFTITGGTGDPGSARSGAGINSAGANATLSNNRIVQNRPTPASIHMTDTRGGGILANGSKRTVVSILNNVIDDNASGRGAGIASSGVGKLVVRGNAVRKNRGYSDHGGGLFIDSPDAEISANLIDGNEIGPTANPYGYGGGVYLHSVGTVVRMSFNIITNNVAVTVGSGVFVDNGAHATLTRELIYGNKCTEAGGAAITVDSTDDAHPVGSVIKVECEGPDADHCMAALEKLAADKFGEKD